MKYDYTKIYNEHWQAFMDETDIEAIGIKRKNKDGSNQFGFSNVFAEDESPYDFCARIGYTILMNLKEEDIGSLEISKGSYMFGIPVKE